VKAKQYIKNERRKKMEKKRAVKPENMEIVFEVKPMTIRKTMPAVSTLYKEEAVVKQFYEQCLQSLLSEPDSFVGNPTVSISILRDGKPNGGYAFDVDFEIVDHLDEESQKLSDDLGTPPEWTEDNYEHELIREEPKQ